MVTFGGKLPLFFADNFFFWHHIFWSFCLSKSPEFIPPEHNKGLFTEIYPMQQFISMFNKTQHFKHGQPGPGQPVVGLKLTILNVTLPYFDGNPYKHELFRTQTDISIFSHHYSWQENNKNILQENLFCTNNMLIYIYYYV